MKTQENKPKDK